MQPTKPLAALDLSSPRWRDLLDGDGPAVKVPGYLSKLANEDDSALDELSCLLAFNCDVGPASLAAFPHLVAAAQRQACLAFRRRLISVAGGIAAWLEPPVFATAPADIVGWYQAALPEALAIARQTLDEDTSENELVYQLQATAALGGHRGAGRVLDGFAAKEFAPTCPHCDEQLYVWPTDSGLACAREDPVFAPGTKFVPVEPNGPSAALSNMYSWLQREAERPRLNHLARPLAALFGTARCPSCQSSFQLMDRLLEEALAT